MSSTSASLVDESSGASHKGAVASGSDDDKGFSTLDGRRCVTLVALVFVYSKRFTSDGGLINLKEGILGDDTTICGDNGTLS